jgi:hypothetical protein
VAQRLAALERENASLRHEVKALRLGRRSLLRNAGAAALGVVGAGGPAQEHIREPRDVTYFDHVHCTHLRGQASDTSGISVPAVPGDLFAVVGIGKTGVSGDGHTGMWGMTHKDGWSGVYGDCHSSVTDGYGVVGDGRREGAGVLGRNSIGTGVQGEGGTTLGTGVRGEGARGVLGKGGTGVWGEGIQVGVRGSCSLAGVWAEGIQFGVDARISGSVGGIGGRFSGHRAQLMLVPRASSGRPQTRPHSKGEIYMDSQGALFVCTADGTPGSWSRFTTTAA